MHPLTSAAGRSSASSQPHDGDPATWVRIGPLDIAVSPLTAEQTASMVARPAGKRLLLNHNLHSVYLHEIDARFRRLYARADRTIVDGAPILWLASAVTRSWFPSSYRTSSTDWLAALPTVAATGRLFVFGASPESNRRSIEALARSLPGWAVGGIDGYVADDAAIRAMARFQPTVVLVGLGMPRQEHFLLEHLEALPDATYATVGGAIDYVAGTTRLAPRWLGRFGVEWLWRLVLEPRRLAHRYLVEPLLLARRLLARNLRGHRRPPTS